MKIRKNIFVLLFISFFTILIGFSCVADKNKEAKVQKRVQLIFWHPFSTDSSIGKTLLGFINEFNKKHPQWYIKAEGMGSYNVLKQKLLASIIAGNQPQMSLAYESWITKFYKAKKLVNFDIFFKNEDEKKRFEDDLFPVFKKSCSINGKLYSLPFNKSMPVLYYNKSLFKKYHIKKVPTTWEEFITVAKKLTLDLNNDGKIDIYGVIGRANITDFLDFLKQNNGEILSSDNKKVLFNQPAGVEALKFFIGWKYLYMFADFYSSGNAYAYQNDFADGKCAMIIGSCVSRYFMMKKLTFPLGTAPIFGHKKKAVQVYGTNIVLFNNTTLEQQKAAWAFIKWFTSPEITALWSKKTSYLPVRKSALKSKILKAEFKKDPGLKSALEQLNYGFLEPNIDSWYLGRQYLSNAINDILIDRKITSAYEKYKEALENNSPDIDALRINLEKVIEQRAKFYLDKAAKKMEKWML